MIVAWGGSVAPIGWLECNGQSTAAYPNLSKIVGAAVPDLRGEFIRGWDHGRGVDGGRGLGSYQADEFRSHSHSINDPGHRHGIPTNNSGDGSGDQSPDGTGVSRYTSYAATGITINASGGNETRPRNIALMYIIKHD